MLFTSEFVSVPIVHRSDAAVEPLSHRVDVIAQRILAGHQIPGLSVTMTVSGS